MTIHSYQALNHPLAQIEAAKEFCVSIEAHVDDSWAEQHGEHPQPLLDLRPETILEALERAQLRFEYDGHDDDEEPDGGFFLGNKDDDDVLDIVLYSLFDEALSAINNLKLIRWDATIEEDTADELREMLVMLHGCGWPGLIFVRDSDRVVHKANMLILQHVENT